MELHSVNGLGGIEGQSPESVNKSIDSLYDEFAWSNDKEPNLDENHFWKDFESTTSKTEVKQTPTLDGDGA